jgi:protein-tyrosine phosphatase
MNNWYDILQMTQVGHRLYVGGYARAADLAKDNPHKITAVLCVHQVMDYPKNPDIIYMHVPFADGEGIPPKQFVKCLGWLKFMYEAGHTIYIHCAAGISRSVTIMASFMHYEGIADFNNALDQIRLNRPNASPAPNTLASAKQMLKVYPYDGTYEQEPEHQKAVHSELIEQVQNRRAAMQHPDEKCPMRIFLLSGDESNTPRHEIPCSCSELLSALDRAKLEVAKQREVIEPSEPIDFESLDREVDGNA